MKKILASLLLLSVAVGYADGQTALTGNKFADNWAIGVNAGGTTPLTHHSFFKNMRPVVGVHVDKYLTPAFGLSLEAMGSFNTTGSKTAFDASNVSLLGLVNLGNLFAGYNGAPRLFEVEASAGLTYHFGCSNGSHHFTEVRPYDQAEVNQLNAQINRLRAEADNTAKVLQDANRKVSDLESELAACRNRKPEVVKDTIDNSKKLLESVITFRQGRISIDNSQLPNVERIATYLRNHKEAGVVIKGYASPEGSAEVNERIARQRAEAVRNMLVNRYRIAKDRIVAEGQGVGYMFEEPDWNRVSICTINTRPDAAEGK